MNQWIVYLRQMKMGEGYLGVSARMVLRDLRGTTAESMKKSAMNRDNPDDWIERIEDLEVSMKSFAPVPIDGADWATLPGGGHMRRVHIGGQDR